MGVLPSASRPGVARLMMNRKSAICVAVRPPGVARFAIEVVRRLAIDHLADALTPVAVAVVDQVVVPLAHLHQPAQGIPHVLALANLVGLAVGVVAGWWHASVVAPTQRCVFPRTRPCG